MIAKLQNQNNLRREIRLRRLRKKILSLIPIPLIIGFIASSILYLRHGWAALEQTLLSWIIGITLIATVLASIYEKYRQS